MTTPDETAGFDETMARIRDQAAAENLRITRHAHQEMVAEDFTLDDVLQALGAGQVLENYPDHKRGACCLIHGVTETGRHLHLVCTTAVPVLIIITAYEPKPPKWVTPVQRGRT